jgi:hypothetical protein
MTALKIDFGYRLKNDRLRYLVPVINGWGEALKRDAKSEPDPAYCFDERANLSILAAGAWLSGATALEEFAAPKGWGTSKSNGRIDLYVGLKNHDVEIEAKRKFYRAGCTDKVLTNIVKTKVKAAVKDAKKDYGAKRQLGCVFFLPEFKKRDFPNFKESPAELIYKQIERFIDLNLVDMWAWCFPLKTRLYRYNYSAPKSICPGVVLGIRHAKARA